MDRISYKPLTFRKLKPGAGYQRAVNSKSVTAGSPALDVMTDLTGVAAATISPDAPLSQATQLMVARGVRLLFVVEPDGEILGLITARDTMGERPIKMLQESRGKHGDLKVRDCMTKRGDIDVLPFAELQRAEVGHVVATLKHVGRQHALVVDTDPLTGEEQVRGIFSVTQIGRQLGMPVQTFEVAKTFAEIEATLAAA